MKFNPVLAPANCAQREAQPNAFARTYGTRKRGRTPDLSLDGVLFGDAGVRPGSRPGPPCSAGCANNTRYFTFKFSAEFLAPVANDLVLDLLSLAEGAQPGSLDCGNVYKHVFAATATRRLNKAIAFRRVKPLHSACRHVTSPGYDPTTLAQRTVKMKWVAAQKSCGAKARPTMRHGARAAPFGSGKLWLQATVLPREFRVSDQRPARSVTLRSHPGLRCAFNLPANHE